MGWLDNPDDNNRCILCIGKTDSKNKMTSFKTRKKDGQVFPVKNKSSRDSGNPSYVGVDKNQIEYEPKSASDYLKNNPKPTSDKYVVIAKGKQTEISTPMTKERAKKLASTTRWASAKSLKVSVKKSKSKPKTKEVFVIQGNYGQGWEDVTEEDKYSEARARLKEYRKNEPQYSHRKIIRRVKND